MLEETRNELRCVRFLLNVRLSYLCSLSAFETTKSVRNAHDSPIPIVTKYRIVSSHGFPIQCEVERKRVQTDHEHPSLKLFVTLREEYTYAAYLSAM